MTCLCGAPMLLMYTGRVWYIWRCSLGDHLLMESAEAGKLLWYRLEAQLQDKGE